MILILQSRIQVVSNSIWVFFLLLLSCNFNDQLRRNYTGLLMCACVEIHKVRRLIFDNYQQCPVYWRKNLLYRMKVLTPCYSWVSIILHFTKALIVTNNHIRWTTWNICNFIIDAPSCCYFRHDKSILTCFCFWSKHKVQITKNLQPIR